MKKYVLIAALSNALMGVLPIYWKLFGSVSTGYILGQRIFWSIPFTLLVVVLQKNWPQLKAAFLNRRKFLLTALAGVVITLNWYVYIWAVANSMVLETSMAYYMSPLITFLFGIFAFKEKCGKAEATAMGVAAAGILISSVSLGVFPWVSIVLAVTFALYGALKSAAGLNPAVSLSIEMLVISPFALIYLSMASFGPRGALNALPTYTYLLFIGSGLISAFPLWLYSYGLKGLPLTYVAFLQFIWPTASLILSVAVLHEPLSVEKMISLVFIWAGLILFTVTRFSKARSSAAAQPEKEALYCKERHSA